MSSAGYQSQPVPKHHGCNNNNKQQQQQPKQQQQKQQQQEQQQQQQKRSSQGSLYAPNDELRELDSDYKDVFMRRLATDMQAEEVQPNDLKRRFGLTKESLEKLLPEYKLLLNRFDVNLFRYVQDVLTTRYLHSKRIDSDTVIETSSTSHKLVEVEPEAPEVTQTRLEAHGRRWQDVQDQRLHQAGRSKLDSVMELIRIEDRPVLAFPDGQQPPSVSPETDGGALVTGDRGGGGGGGLPSSDDGREMV